MALSLYLANIEILIFLVYANLMDLTYYIIAVLIFTFYYLWS